jgi:nucleotide-binding universal stress UspA family protein
MKTIIVPTDFSPVSINAMNYAAEMAAETGSSLLLLNVFQIPISLGEQPMPMISMEEMEKSSREKLESLRESLFHVNAGKLKIYIEARLGDTIDQLQDICEHIKPFAVVMGSHGHSGWERLVMGSTTLSAIRNLSWPVIVVPPGTRYHSIKRVGLACDFKEVVESTPVDFIKKMIESFKVELHILNVVSPDGGADHNKPLESAYLETLLGDPKPHYHFLEREDIVEGINEFAEKNNLDMIWVIPKKHKLLEGLFHKSSSKELVTHAHIPILSIHE